MRKKVLICDDDHDLLEMTSIILSKNDLDVHTLDDMTNLMKEVKNIGPQIILMDLNMPNVDGEMAVKMLNEDNSTSTIPVVLFSADPILEETANHLGVKCLRKPFEINELRNVIIANV